MAEFVRQGLSEKEVEQLLLLMEGDISDLDIEEDDDGAELNTPDIVNEYANMPEIVETNMPEIVENIGMGFQVAGPSEEKCDISNQGENSNEGYDSEDELPLSTFQRTCNSKRKRIYTWRQKDIDQIFSECDSNDSTPNNIDLSPLDYFRYFFDESLISDIAYQSNLYSVEKKGVSIKTNKEDMEQFLGIQILSGIVKMPSYRMYWSEATRYSPIADVMSRNRFDCLRNFIHLNDNSKMKARDDPEYDKLFKVRPVIDAVRHNLSTLEPEEQNSVDEIIIPFKGRSSLKQYVRNKPHKWGIKMFARAGSSGIIYDFEIYVGKGTVTEVTELGISGDIVVRLCENVPKGANYKVYCDNWFTSPLLFCKLKDLGILATGTVRSNRLPACNLKTDKELKQLGRGSFDYCTDTQNNLIAVKWYDNKSVHLLSSFRGIHPIDNVQRWSVADKLYTEVQRPAIVRQYNTFMGGVDLHDMLVSLYRINFVVKRYLRIFYNLVDMCIVNAWLLYRRHLTQRQENKYKTLVQFRSEIAHAMIKAGKENVRKRGRPLSAIVPSQNTPPPKKRAKVALPLNDVRYDNLGHFPIHIEPKQRCRLCIQNYSRIMCEKCGMALCLTKDKNCFKSFHSRN